MGKGVKRHWSQSAAGAVGHGITMAKRLHRVVSKARQYKRVAKRFAGSLRQARRGQLKKKTDVTGTFVKCKDWKVKKFGKRTRRSAAFARKVTNVVYSGLPRSTELYSYAWAASNTASTSNTAVKWVQFCLDPLQAAFQSYNIANGQLSPSVVTEPGNPSGIAAILAQENAIGATVTAATGPTVSSSTFDKVVTGAGFQGAMNKEVLWRQTASQMRVQFKNIKSYAMTLEVMIVKPKRTMSKTVTTNNGVWYQTDAAALTGLTQMPSGWVASDQQGMTPLELAQLGLARVGADTDSGKRLYLWNNPMLSLNDSQDFNEFYKITQKCKVYLPPGGVVEKSIYHKGGRTLRAPHVTNNLFDTRTSFMVVKYIPEVQLLDVTGGEAILGPGVPRGVVENGSAHDLVGTVYYRMGFKQLYGPTPESNVHQYNRQIISSYITGGQATSIHAKAP